MTRSRRSSNRSSSAARPSSSSASAAARARPKWVRLVSAMASTAANATNPQKAISPRISGPLIPANVGWIGGPEAPDPPGVRRGSRLVEALQQRTLLRLHHRGLFLVGVVHPQDVEQAV